MTAVLDIAGKRFGRLVAVRIFTKTPRVKWYCLCDCGKESTPCSSSLVYGHTTSCGCLQKEAFTNRTHGKSNTTEYTTWHRMIRRCHNKKHSDFRYYGGRGISVCKRWRDSFECFLSDLGKRPSGMTLDRIDNNGNYEPGNCRWASRLTQSNNRRNTVVIEAFGETKVLSDWCVDSRCKVRATQLYQRIYTLKMPPEIAMTKPIEFHARSIKHVK